jgi:hypothetical protein
MRKRYTYEDGGVFEGNVDSKESAQGYGVFRYGDGTVYEGNWKDDLWDGPGVLSYPNGWVYRGNFREGYFDGGFRIEGPGTVVTLTFDRGYIDESGNNTGVSSAVIDYAIGIHYEGQINGHLEPHGWGTITTDNGNVITGEFTNGMEDGQVTIRQADGLEMRGEKHGLTMTGMWVFEWPDRRVYAEIHDGRMGDSGEIYGARIAKIQYRQTGEVYLGEVNGYLEPDGYGRIEKPDGEIVSGDWENGILEKVTLVQHR